jgi:hypothetical protein
MKGEACLLSDVEWMDEHWAAAKIVLDVFASSTIHGNDGALTALTFGGRHTRASASPTVNGMM